MRFVERGIVEKREENIRGRPVAKWIPVYGEAAKPEIERARAHYRDALPGLTVLPARSRRCVRLAWAVYGGILGRIEQAGCDVLAGRAVVPRWQRAAAVVRELGRPA